MAVSSALSTSFRMAMTLASPFMVASRLGIVLSSQFPVKNTTVLTGNWELRTQERIVLEEKNQERDPAAAAAAALGVSGAVAEFPLAGWAGWGLAGPTPTPSITRCFRP